MRPSRLELGQFEVRYHAAVGALYAELDRLQVRIDECYYRIERIQQGGREEAKEERAFKDLIRVSCETTGVVELTAHARAINGQIDVKVTERRGEEHHLLHGQRKRSMMRDRKNR